MERRPAVGSKCGVGILHVCQVKDHHQERSDNNIDCSSSHLAHYIKKTVTVRFILDHPVYSSFNTDYPRQQKFRAMNGAHLASTIRGELCYSHWPHVGTQFIALLGTKFGAH